MLLNLHEFAILQYPSMNRLLHVWALLQTKIVETPPTRQVISCTCRHFVVGSSRSVMLLFALLDMLCCDEKIVAFC